MLMNALNLGVSTEIYGLMLTNLLNDVMLGKPKIREAIDGSEVVTKTLTEDLVNITGGKLIIEGDVVKAADKLEAIMEERRRALNI